MNLETILRGCRLRPPSAKVRAALFGPPPPRAAAGLPPAAPGSPLFQAWFAPLAATGVLVLSLATVWQSSGQSTAASLAIASLGAPWDAPLTQVERNALPRPSFRSTTGAGVTPSFGSLLLRQTNVLAR